MNAFQSNTDPIFRDRPLTGHDCGARPETPAKLWSRDSAAGGRGPRLLDDVVQSAMIVCVLISLSICASRLTTLPPYRRSGRMPAFRRKFARWPERSKPPPSFSESVPSPDHKSAALDSHATPLERSHAQRFLAPAGIASRPTVGNRLCGKRRHGRGPADPPVAST